MSLEPKIMTTEVCESSKSGTFLRTYIDGFCFSLEDLPELVHYIQAKSTAARVTIENVAGVFIVRGLTSTIFEKV